MGDDNNTWNDDLHNQPFYDPTRASSSFNLLFAAIWGLILTRITKMGILAPDGVNRNLKDIFDMKMPAFSDDDDGCAIPGAERQCRKP